MAIGAVAVANGWYGVMLGWRFPMRPGTTPAFTNADAWLISAASADDSRLTSMN